MFDFDSDDDELIPSATSNTLSVEPEPRHDNVCPTGEALLETPAAPPAKSIEATTMLTEHPKLDQNDTCSTTEVAAGVLSISTSYDVGQKKRVVIDWSCSALASLHQRFEAEGGEGRSDEHQAHSFLHKAQACRHAGEEPDQELQFAENALEQFRRTGDRAGEATALCTTCEAHLSRGDLAAAFPAAAQALDVYTSIGQKLGIAATLLLLVKAHVLFMSDDIAREAFFVLRDLGITMGEFAAILGSADWHLATFGIDAACHMATEKLRAHREASSTWGVAVELWLTIYARIQKEGSLQARNVTNDALALCKELGIIWKTAACPLELLDIPRSSVAADLSLQRVLDQVAKARSQDNKDAHVMALLDLALVHLAMRSPSDALKAASEAHALCKCLSNNEGIAIAMLLMIDAYLSKSASEDAAPFALEAMMIFCGLGHRKGQALTLHRMALIAFAIGDLNDAQDKATQSLTMFREMGSRRGEASTLYLLVLTRESASNLQDVNDAITMGSEAGQLFCGIDDKRGVSGLLAALAPMHLFVEKVDDAKTAAHDSLRLAREVNDLSCELQALQAHVRVQLALGSRDVVDTAKEALQVAKEVGDKRAEDTAMLYLVKGLLSADEPDKAIRWGEQVRSLFKDAGDKKQEAEVSLTLAKAYVAKRQPSRATAIGEETLECAVNLGDRALQSALLQLLVEANLAAQEFAMAMKHANSAWTLWKEGDNRREEAIALQSIARVHLAKKEPMRAASVGKDAQKIMHSIGDISGEISALRTVVNAYLSRKFKQDGVENAVEYIMESVQAFRETKAINAEARMLQVLSEVHAGNFEPEVAVRVLGEAVELFRKSEDRSGELSALQAVVNRDLIRGAAVGTDAALRTVKQALTMCEKSDYKPGAAAMLHTLFISLLAKDKVEHAWKAGEEALKLYKDLKDTSGAAQMMLVIAKANLQQSQAHKALKKAKDALQIFRESGDKTAERETLEVITKAIFEKGDAQASFEVARKTLSLCREIGDRRGEASMYQIMVNTHLDSGGLEGTDAATTTAKEALVLFRDLKDKQGEASTLHALGKRHLLRGELKEALRMVQDALSLYQQVGDRVGEAKTLNTIAKAHLDQNQPGDALGPSIESLEIFRELGDKHGEAMVLPNIINTRLLLGHADAALRAGMEAQILAKKAGDEKGEGAALRAIANTHLSMGAPVQALLAVRDGLTIYKKLKDKLQEGELLSLAVKAHIQVSDVEEAVRTAKDARWLFRDCKEKRGEAKILEELAQIHVARNEPTQALKAAEDAVAIASTLDDTRAEASAKLALARICNNIGETAQALMHAASAESLFQKVADKRGQASVWDLIAQAHLWLVQMALESAEAHGIHAVPTKDAREASKAAKQARSLSKAVADIHGEVNALHLDAKACLGRSDIRDAVRLAEEALTVSRRAKDKHLECQSLILCTLMYIQDQRYTPAKKNALEAKALAENIGDQDSLWSAEQYLEAIAEATLHTSMSEENVAVGYQAQPGAYRSNGQPGRAAPAVRKGRKDDPPLFNRKSFPWTVAGREAAGQH